MTMTRDAHDSDSAPGPPAAARRHSTVTVPGPHAVTGRARVRGPGESDRVWTLPGGLSAWQAYQRDPGHPASDSESMTVTGIIIIMIRRGQAANHD